LEQVVSGVWKRFSGIIGNKKRKGNRKMDGQNHLPNLKVPFLLLGYTLQQSLFIISEVIEKVENLALNPDELLESNIFFQRSSLENFYSKIDLLKKDLLTKATKNARERAEKILQDSNYHPGRMISAKAGVFQIIEPYSTEVESYGMYNTSSRKKDITVTVHAQFLIQ